MTSEEATEQKLARAGRILIALQQAYPEAQTELRHENPYQLLVATILSAQATDRSVNLATPALFARFSEPADLAAASVDEVAELIRHIGLYRNKAANLVAMAKILMERFAGQVPSDPELLMTLPGVGWKTATVVAGAGFGVPGIAVDTHVTRLAHRLGLSQKTDPRKIGSDLQALFPQQSWVFVHHALVLHGRYVCLARKPRCQSCVLYDDCCTKGEENLTG